MLGDKLVLINFPFDAILSLFLLFFEQQLKHNDYNSHDVDTSLHKSVNHIINDKVNSLKNPLVFFLTSD